MSYCLYVVLFRFVLFTNLDWVHLQLAALADRCEILAVSVASFGSNEKFGCDIAHFADCQKFGCGWSFTLHPAVFQPWKKLLRTLIHILRYNRSYQLIYTWVWRINDNYRIEVHTNTPPLPREIWKSRTRMWSNCYHSYFNFWLGTSFYNKYSPHYNFFFLKSWKWDLQGE